jgi:hypothetical protein
MKRLESQKDRKEGDQNMDGFLSADKTTEILKHINLLESEQQRKQYATADVSKFGHKKL